MNNIKQILFYKFGYTWIFKRKTNVVVEMQKNRMQTSENFSPDGSYEV